MNFADLGLDPSLLRAISSEGYTSPTPIQTQAIPHVLRGCDVLGCAQTGTGKTAAFALPILHHLMQSAANSPPRVGKIRGSSRLPRVLVLSPTRELAGQIGDSFRTYGRHAGLRHTVVFGGVSQQPQVRDLQRGVDILVATPGRLVDLMGQGYVDLSRIEVYVLDEADRMLDMGFLPDLRRLQAKLPADRQTLFFSATMPDAIRQLADSLLSDPVRIRIAPVEATTKLIAESVCFVPKQSKPRLLTDLLTAEGVVRAMVFTRTKHGADRVARHLNQAGIRAEAMHGNKSQSARQRTLAGFKSERPPVLVATDVAARGIDVDNVSHVFNYDLPHEPEMYVHRIGRTGRAGAAGIAVSFCEDQERKLLQSIERLIRRKLLVGQSVAGSEAAADAAPARAATQEPPRQSPARRWKSAKSQSSRSTTRKPAAKSRRW
jgi:ATP-dependent RNA helicase RhlE